ncbi:pentapeptide repeat-containing protein [Gordonia sp. 'Campus']|uniref:pentapeptide repeat-containing protein n=1 Tax=Gordonia sp. 'Campus' TaxID=2915824 RepID=UPI001EE45383|nr:pentapeptide repeat-containing protein [Gordonia sp. 'Campus']
MRKTQWIAAVAGAGGGAAVIYAIPPVLYSCLADDENWGEFFKAAAPAYGATTAGLLAVAAASLALHNGRQDRKARQIVDDRGHNAESIRELRSRYTTAVEQLADTRTTISQAGVYAIAAIADDWLRINLPDTLQINTKAEAQTCINVLTAYLRQQHPNFDHDDIEYRHEGQVDQVIRDTILRTIVEHLRPGHDGQSWTELTFDLNGATLHNVNFEDCVFKGAANFGASRFYGRRTAFSNVRFNGAAIFAQAQFFGNNTEFAFAQFCTGANFEGAKFRSADKTLFDFAVFGAITSFADAAFYSNETHFGDADFGSPVTFKNAIFGGELVSFESPVNWKNVIFDWNDDVQWKPPNVVPKLWPPQVAKIDPAKE